MIDKAIRIAEQNRVIAEKAIAERDALLERYRKCVDVLRNVNHEFRRSNVPNNYVLALLRELGEGECACYIHQRDDR